MKKFAFHLSLPCLNIEDTKKFYVNTLGATLGRYSENWIDINLHGNQVTFTKTGNFKFDYKNYRFENEILPSFHFGVIVDVELWGKLYSKLFGMNLEVTAEATFLKNKLGEHLSFFVMDPNGYEIEFKNFKNEDEIFSS